MTAVYNGDATYATSVSSAVAQTVTAIFTLTGVTGFSKVYDQTTTATVNLTNLIGVLPSDSNMVQIAAGYIANLLRTKNVGTAKTILCKCSLSLTGGAASNYTISSTASTVGNTAHS